jgi:hypothetical protein
VFHGIIDCTQKAGKEDHPMKAYGILLVALLLGLAVLSTGCGQEDQGGQGGLPSSLEQQILNQAREGSKIISVQEGQSLEGLENSKTWCVVTEDTAGKERFLASQLRVGDEDQAGLAAVVITNQKSTFDKVKCTNWDG